MKALNRYLDHAVLKPELTQAEAEEAIVLGLKFDTRTVCTKLFPIRTCFDPYDLEDEKNSFLPVTGGLYSRSGV